jgi:hypothetical protein
MLEITDVFLKLSNGLSSFDFSNLKLLDKTFRIKLSAFNDTKNIGLRQTSPDNYEWRVTSEKWYEFREKLTTMYRNGNGGHHYLDSDPIDNNDLQVVFSWDEYPLTFWERHTIPAGSKHQVWQDNDGLTTLCLADERGDDCRNLLESGSCIIHEFFANSHFEAMTIYYKFMDWGIYTTEFEIDKQPYDKKNAL